MASFKDITGQAKQFWASRDLQQKRLLMAGTGATVLLMAVFVWLMGSPDYKPLSTGLDPETAQRLAAQLDAQNIPHQVSADGKTISVPANKLDAAHMAIASLGSAPGERSGFELFDKMSWGQTEFDQKVAYQRALEGELERSIETLSDVERARVHLVMPTDSVFLDRQRPAKASVILKLRGNGLSPESVQAIARLVSSAVDELQPEDVSIVDADSARELGLGHNGQPAGDSQEATLTQRLIATLEPVVGVDKIRASVDIDRDEGTTDQSEEKYDPTVSALLSDQKTEDRAGGAAATTGVPGTASNVPSAKAKPAIAPDPTQMSTSDNAQYGVNKVITHTMIPAGRIQRISAAILVDDEVVRTVRGGKVSFTRRKRTQDELNRIQQLAEAVIGYDAKRGDVISVEDMSFDADGADADLTAPSWVEQQAKTLSNYSALLRPLSLLALFLLAYAFVLRPIQKQALSPALAPVGEAAILAAGTGPERLALVPEDLGDHQQRAAQLKEQAVELIKQKPVNTARAVRAWLREETL